ncbi:hypothetical protein Q7F05_07620 [Pseudomonas sp. Lb2C1-1]|uniref:hypothetical protein n=1 Tax=Pseudomonas TaxID=286 RepID=UPI0039193D94
MKDEHVLSDDLVTRLDLFAHWRYLKKHITDNIQNGSLCGMAYAGADLCVNRPDWFSGS